MSKTTLEKRLSTLESRVSELGHLINQSPRPKDWRRSIGAFTNDPAMQAVFDDAIKIRSADRGRARRRRAAKKPTRA